MLWTLTCIAAALYVANSAFGLARAITDYDWYVARVTRYGVQPNLKRLLMVKAVTLTTGVFIICWTAAKAGYI